MIAIRRLRPWLLTLPALFGLFAPGTPAAAAPPDVPPHARGLGRLAPGQTLSLALALPLRDPAGLRALLRRLYDPHSPSYGRYLSSDEFTRRYGPTEADYEAVAAYARRQGLTVTGVHPNRLLLDVGGPAGAVEAAFGVRLMRYQGVDGRPFHMPDAAPVVPAALAGKLEGVIGLDDSVLAQPHSLRRLMAPASTPAGVGSGPGGGLAPADIKAAYGLAGAAQTGAGRTLALYELDGYTASDVSRYETNFGLPQVPLQDVLVGQANGAAGAGAGEVTLDIELMAALAPGAARILVYQGKNGTSDMIDVFNRIATDNVAKEVSTSWGIPEDRASAAILNTENNIFQQMAAQGQSLYAASGDSGAYDDGKQLSVDDPASQPYVTGVGGTRLTTAGAGGAYRSESAWANTLDTGRSPFGSGGGGGVSQVWSIPDYQVGINPTANGGSGTARNVPDVSLDADPRSGYAIYFGGRWVVYGGTSCAAPLWAAFTALVNQQKAGAGKPPLGFPNPALYQAALGPQSGADFHDIADGSSNLGFTAGPGYDNATGWGSFNGAALLGDLAGTTGVQKDTQTAILSSPNPSAVGQSVTFTVTVTAVAGNVTPAGTVQFSIDGTRVGGPFTLDGSGTVTATDSGLTQGAHTVAAAYTSTDGLNGSTGSLTQTVGTGPAGGRRYVSPSGSDTNDGSQSRPKRTIQAAVDAASDGDTVIVTDGTYSGDGDRDIDFGGKNITVTSQNGAAKTVIDCGGSASTDGSGNHRGFYLHSAETGAVISGFTVRNGYETYVYAVADSGAGGGVCINGSSATVQDCVITGNTATSVGGGVFSGNGGAGRITLANCTVTGNSVPSGDGGGGGVFNNETGAILMAGCTVTGNATAGVGGGVCNVAGVGAILLANCTVSGNTGAGGGGGVYNSNVGGATELANCTLTGNDSQGAGSDGVYNGDYYTGGTITLLNDILYADGGGTAEVANDPTGIADAVATRCDIQGGYPGAGGIDADPLFVNAAAADLHLRPGSPCLGAGTATGAPAADKDGHTRPDPPSIGAYEGAAGGHTHLLWNDTDGRVMLWSIAQDGTFTLNGFGPYTDGAPQNKWSATAVATGSDGKSHLLWNNTDGRVMLWTVDDAGGFTLAGYGPYTDNAPQNKWSATAVSVGPDNVTHLLWNNTDGRVMLWSVAPDFTFTLAGFGPYTDNAPQNKWSAAALSTGPDGKSHILWTNTDNRVMLWNVASDFSFTLAGYGPYTDGAPQNKWSGLGLSVGPDNVQHLLWANTDRRAMFWDVNPDFSFTLAGYGPYTDGAPQNQWSAAAVATGPDGMSHLLWGNTDDRAMLWGVDSAFGFTVAGYGPYTDNGPGNLWSATAISAGP